jgi:hypothetical protein
LKFRVARHTNHLEQLKDFYVNLIGLSLLGEFKNHSGYDGVFIGNTNLDWHLEFTRTVESVDHKFDDDDILVFYPETQHEYDHLLEQINTLKVVKSLAKNPYWQENGITIKDPDGHTVVISNLKIKVSEI